MMSGMVPSMFPAHKFLVYLTGICFLLAAIAFIINRYAKIAGYLLALMLLIIICTIHVPGMMNAADEGSKMMFTTNAVKDLGLAMAQLLLQIFQGSKLSFFFYKPGILKTTGFIYLHSFLI